MFTVLLFFRWSCRRECDLPVLFLCHLDSKAVIFIFRKLNIHIGSCILKMHNEVMYGLNKKIFFRNLGLESAIIKLCFSFLNSNCFLKSPNSRASTFRFTEVSVIVRHQNLKHGHCAPSSVHYCNTTFLSTDSVKKEKF